jgi:hypothetical protein
MKKYLFFFIIFISLLLISLIIHKEKNEVSLNGIWTQKNINWIDGSFHTIYIYNETEFIRIASTQNRNKNGTINFRVEPGIIIDYGHIQKFSKGNLNPIMKYRLVERTFKLSNEKVPSAIKSSELIIEKNNNGSWDINFEKEKYLKNKSYTNESVKSIKSLADIYVPQLLKEYNITNFQ